MSSLFRLPPRPFLHAVRVNYFSAEFVLPADLRKTHQLGGVDGRDPVSVEVNTILFGFFHHVTSDFKSNAQVRDRLLY